MIDPRTLAKRLFEAQVEQQGYVRRFPSHIHDIKCLIEEVFEVHTAKLRATQVTEKLWLAYVWGEHPLLDLIQPDHTFVVYESADGRNIFIKDMYGRTTSVNSYRVMNKLKTDIVRTCSEQSVSLVELVDMIESEGTLLVKYQMDIHHLVCNALMKIIDDMSMEELGLMDSELDDVLEVSRKSAIQAGMSAKLDPDDPESYEDLIQFISKTRDPLAAFICSIHWPEAIESIFKTITE